MNIEIVKLLSLKDDLNQHIKAFSDGWSLICELVPNQILEVLDERHFEYTIKDLTFWKDWEYGKKEISDDLFISEVLGDLTNSGKEVVLVFDDCFKTGEAYKVIAKEMTSLKANLKFEETLFEPFDHIFYIKSENTLILVHHEGKVITVDLASAW
ncbi:hypothetical protein [Edaphocola flava]|uniref:hypothetical protein n=1 Tax=Edaphocola flava TaxID=2499629 RepID=UPI00100B8E74|nr:hypothetical protein [Edaphocola flava]